MSSNQEKSQIIYTDEQDKNHLDQIARHTGEATDSQVTAQELQPVKNKNPLNDSEIADLMEGLQGKPRTAKASDFLKDKLNWLKKKHGSGVKLIKK